MSKYVDTHTRTKSNNNETNVVEPFRITEEYLSWHNSESNDFQLFALVLYLLYLQSDFMTTPHVTMIPWED